MNNTVQHKMQGHEVAPPPGVWEKIAAELDEPDLSQSLLTKLKSLEVNPPDIAWQVIAASLSATELPGTFVERLQKIEITPPDGTWKKIKTVLDAEHESAIPERRLFSPLLKFAAAAAFIGLIVYGSIQLINKDRTNDINIVDTPPVNQPSNIQTVTTEVASADVSSRNAQISTIPADQQTVLAEEKRNDAALEASKKTFATLNMATSRRLKKIAAGYHFSADPGIAGFIVETENNDHSARYITVMTPDCNLVRISKKLEHLSCCVTGEVVDTHCKMQMEKWRKQIASSPSGHTASFIDLLDLVDALGVE
jgi:hypothetical protein